MNGFQQRSFPVGMRLLAGVMLSVSLSMFSSVVIDLPRAEARVAAPAGAKCAAAARVQRAAADFLRAGRSGSPAALQRALERHVAMRRVMNFALGKHRRKLSAVEQRRFHAQARRYVARRLASMGRGIAARKVRIVGCRGSIVETLAEPGNIRVLWRVRGSRIVDVNYRGMWLASMLRSHFDRLMRNAGGDVRTFLAQLK